MEENRMQNSLTSPADLDRSEPKSFNVRKTLTDQEADEAFKELHVTDFVEKFPRFETLFADPPIPNQVYSLISWVPARGATPDKDGVYGMIKSRGNFSTREEADLNAERLIKTGDSYHSIYQSYVGRPFPLASSKKYISETVDIEVKKKIVDTNSGQIRKLRDEEKNTMKELEEKEKELKADVDENKFDDPLELYTETMVKKAQLQWTYYNTTKKLEAMKKTIIGARVLIDRMNTENPEYKITYMERYMAARKKSGLPDTDDSFLKYLGEDLDLGF
jgi:hypothetical protein